MGVIDQERVDILNKYRPLLSEYYAYKRARDIGIVFTASEMEYSKVSVFCIIENKLTSLRTNDGR